MFERCQTVRCRLNVIGNTSRIVCRRYVSYKLTVNVNVSKMAFVQKIQVRLNREGGIYSIIIQQIVTMPIYGKEALNICHPT